MKVEYLSNNSGGSWWLSDGDWKNLEKAGWEIVWGKEYFCHSQFSFNDKPEGKPEPCESANKCHGHRRFDSWQEMTEKDRWLGCLAKEATKEFQSITDALREFEKITGQSVTDEGCNCCGAPHTFSWKESGEDQYASGDELAAYLYNPKLAGKSKRELLEEIQKAETQ